MSLEDNKAVIRRLYDAFETVQRVVYARRAELFLVYFLGGIVILMAASFMYLVEFRDPSGNFNSIPKTIWWAIITLTTVGYGDVVPATALGKVLASVIALTGVAFIALPAGLLGAGFIEEFEKIRDATRTSKNKPAASSVLRTRFASLHGCARMRSSLTLSLPSKKRGCLKENS